MRVRVSLMSGAIWEGGELSGATYIHTPIYIYVGVYLGETSVCEKFEL